MPNSSPYKFETACELSFQRCITNAIFTLQAALKFHVNSVTSQFIRTYCIECQLSKVIVFFGLSQTPCWPSTWFLRKEEQIAKYESATIKSSIWALFFCKGLKSLINLDWKSRLWCHTQFTRKRHFSEFFLWAHRVQNSFRSLKIGFNHLFMILPILSAEKIQWLLGQTALASEKSVTRKVENSYH